MRLTILGLLLMLAQLALSMDWTGDDTKSGLEAAGTQAGGLQGVNSEETEGHAEESATEVAEGDSEKTDGDTATSTAAGSLEPDGKNSDPASSADKEENGSADYEHAQQTEPEHSSESNSPGSSPETGDTQPMEFQPAEVCLEDVYDDKTLILVISSDSQPQTSTHNVYMNDKPVKLYVPVKGYKYSKIKDKEVTMWKAHGEEYAYAVYEAVIGRERNLIMILAGGAAPNKYCYKKQGGSWVRIMPYMYYAKIFTPLEPEMQYTVYSLDASGNHGKYSTLVECYLDEVHTKMYFDRKGSRAGVVRYGDQKLYEITSLLETFSKVKISLLFERPVYMDIELFTLAFKRNVRFAMFGGEWKPIPSPEYYESMERHKEYHKNEKNESSVVVAVNLNGPDEEKLLITDRSPPEHSVRSVEYAPKNGKKVGYVIAEGHVIWMSPLGEDCTVLSTYKRNLAVLVMIEFRDDRPTEFLSYEGRWTEVPSQKYYDRIVELYTM